MPETTKTDVHVSPRSLCLRRDGTQAKREVGDNSLHVSCKQCGTLTAKSARDGIAIVDEIGIRIAQTFHNLPRTEDKTAVRRPSTSPSHWTLGMVNKCHMMKPHRFPQSAKAIHTNAHGHLSEPGTSHTASKAKTIWKNVRKL